MLDRYGGLPADTEQCGAVAAVVRSCAGAEGAGAAVGAGLQAGSQAGVACAC